MFDVFDRNGKGGFNIEELKVVMMNMGERITDAEAATIIRELDVSGEGEVRFEEFLHFMQRNNQD